MPFVQAPVNYAVEYARDLANAYPYLSYFNEIWNGPNSTKYKPVTGKTIMVPSMTTSGARAVDRDQINGVFTRNWNNDWQPLTMRMDREWDTLVDPMDIQETNMVATIAHITETFNQFQKIPEQDAYVASTLATAAESFGSVDTTTLSAENILATWDGYLAYMVNQRVNRDQIVAYMTPDAYKYLKEAAGITRFISADTGIRNVDRNVGKLDGVLIKEVPADMMMNAYDFTDGWQVKSGARQVNMLLVNPLSTCAPIVYDTAMTSAPTAQSKGKWLYYERYYYDVFVLNQRLPGILANISGTNTLGTLTFTTSAGADSTHTIINGLAPAPYGMAYVAKSDSAADLPTYGEALTSGWTPVTNGTALTTAASQVITVALVNTTKGNIAVSGGSATAVVGS
jgi:hypothetical protein